MTAPVRTEALSAAQAAAYLALVQAQGRTQEQLTRAAVVGALNVLRSFDGWFSTDEINRMIRRVLRVVTPAQVQSARVTDAYLARVLTQMRGRTVRPVGAVNVTQLRRKLPDNVIDDLVAGRRAGDVLEIGDTENGPNDGIDWPLADLTHSGDEVQWQEPGAAYGRLADTYRRAVLVDEVPEQQAMARVLERAESTVRTDFRLVTRKQSNHTMSRRGVQLYRRVLHPERSESGLSCGLCIVAADRIYTVAEFKDPIHENCKCENIPIENVDPGLRLNQDDLDDLYAAAGKAVGKESETGGGKRQLGALKRVRVAITEHGELGPILINASGSFRDVTDYARSQRRGTGGSRSGSASSGQRAKPAQDVDSPADVKRRLRIQLTALETKLADLRQRSAGGENVSRPLAFHQQRIAAIRQQLS